MGAHEHLLSLKEAGPNLLKISESAEQRPDEQAANSFYHFATQLPNIERDGRVRLLFV